MSQNNKYSIWIKIISVAIPVVVAILFTVKIPNATPLSFLPPIYACINALTAVLLVIALIAIKSKKIKLHEWLMKTCIGLSLIFLVMYIAYHMTTDPTPFGGQDYIKIVYFFILISHILLVIFQIPLVILAFLSAFRGQFEKHKKIVRFTLPIWVYISITGILIYLMLYQF